MIILRTFYIVIASMALMAAGATAAYQLYGIWAALGTVGVVAWICAKLATTSLKIGAFVQQQRTPLVVDDEVYEDYEEGKDYEDYKEGEDEVVAAIQNAARIITDPDLQEALNHLAHLANDCEDSVNHATQLKAAFEHLQMRLVASPVLPKGNETQPTSVH